MTLDNVIGSAIGSAAVALAFNFNVRRWAIRLHAWLEQLAHHVDFEAPPAPDFKER